MPKRATTIRLDDDLIAEIHRCAEDRGISAADFIRQAIVFYLGYLHGQHDAAAKRDPPEQP